MILNNLKVEATQLWKDLSERKLIQLSSSTLEAWDNCFARGLYFDAFRRQPTFGASALLFGSAFHAALEVHLKGGTISEMLDAARTVAIEGGLTQLDDPKRTVDILDRLVREYVVDYAIRPHSLEPVVVDGEPLVEKTFAFHLGDVEHPVDGSLVSVIWRGKIDALIERNGELWVVDHKTTSMMGDRFADDKLRSNQFIGYTWAGRQLTEALGKPVRGVILNAASPQKSGNKYREYVIPYPEWVFDEWQAEVLDLASGIIRGVWDFAQTGWAVPTRSSCVTKYGKCPYFQVCQAAPLQRGNFLFGPDYKESDYHVKEES